MDGSNYILGRPKDKDNYHSYELFGLQQSGTIEDHCETMEEFNEEDIWGSLSDAEAKQVCLHENGFNAVPICRTMGVKESCQEDNNMRMRYQSAPVNIPDWSQILWEEKRNDNYRRSQLGLVDDDSDDNEDGDGTDFKRIPPHEVVARQLSQSEITSFSVYEGIGRTLKGRDLRRVRNAILTRTGFIE